MIDSDWGQSDWGTFLYGAGDHAILGYPADDPAITISVGLFRPYHTPVKKKQPVDYSNGGDPYIYNKGLTEYSFEASLRLTAAEKQALQAFYDNTADGKANPIYYADPDGNEYTVRIMNEEFDFQEEAYNKYTGKLKLVVSP